MIGLFFSGANSDAHILEVLWSSGNASLYNFLRSSFDLQREVKELYTCVAR